jgi:glycosyltransferase involved in cell wall biosynthesis
MRVLHVIQRYWPAVGGAEIHMGELSRRFVADGHQVTVVTTDALDFELLSTPGGQRISAREEQIDGVRVLRFPVHHLPFSPLSFAAWRRGLYVLSALRPIPSGWISSLSLAAPWLPEMWRWFRTTEQRFDLVGALNIGFEPLFVAGQRFARRRGIPFVSHPIAHLGAGERPGEDPVGQFHVMRHQVALVRASDGVAAQTPTARRFYIAQGAPAERVHVVGPGVNPHEILGGKKERFVARYGIRAPLVAYLGAMAYDKGTVQVVEAVRALWRAGHEVELVLAGAILSAFQRYLEQLPIEDRQRIRVLGPIDETEKRDLLAAADVVAMPSRTDSFGLVYLEAWLYRKPVIGAQTWGVGDVIEDGVDGVLVPFDDSGALAEALLDLLEHPERRAEMGARGEAKVYRLHTWQNKYQSVCALYTELVRSGECPPSSAFYRAMEKENACDP